MKIHNIPLLFAIATQLFHGPVTAQPLEDHLQISLLTCSELKPMYASFGHSAVRVVDHAAGTDIVFDYGVFRFSEPGFVWKFLRGDLMYRVAPREFEGFVRSNALKGRGVVEERLVLTPGQEQLLHETLLENIKPEHMYYRYDFLLDNCATRVRDLFGGEDYLHPGTPAGRSFRDHLGYYLDGRRWLQFGIDLILGAPVDREMTYEQEMFLPEFLSRNLNDFRNLATGTGLVGKTLKLLPPEDEELQGSPALLQPVVVFSLLLLVLMVLFLTKRRVVRRISPFLYALFGLAGIQVAFMWFGTSHTATAQNWNLLWLNPVYLCAIPFPGSLFNRIAVLVATIMTAGALVFWWLIPQEFNIAVLPLAGLLLVASMASLKKNRQDPA